MRHHTHTHTHIHTQRHTLPAENITLSCAHAHLFTLNTYTQSLTVTHTHTHTHTVGRGGGRSGLGVVKGAVCYVMEGRNGFALSDRPSQRLCFMFDIIVSPLTGPFINGFNGQSETG